MASAGRRAPVSPTVLALSAASDLAAYGGSVPQENAASDTRSAAHDDARERGGSPEYASPAAALAAITGALAYLAGPAVSTPATPAPATHVRPGELAVADLTDAELADCLAGLERAESAHTAAHARLLGAFDARKVHQADGQRTAKAWLTWKTLVTPQAAARSVGWARRLAEHPAIADVLARMEISASWARELCRWSDRLPAEYEAGRPGPGERGAAWPGHVRGRRVSPRAVPAAGRP